LKAYGEDRLVEVYISSHNSCDDASEAYKSTSSKWWCDVSVPGKELKIREGVSIDFDPTCGRKNTPQQDSGKSIRQQVIDYAAEFLGVPYVKGGSTPSGFDCSGFTSYVYDHFGYKISRNSTAQRSDGVGISLSEILPGDLVCYSGHVAIYVGDGKVIHAPHSRDVVKYGNLHMMKILDVRRIIN